MADVVDASMCVECRVNEAAWDSEPPNPGYFSRCSRCSFLSGYDPQGLGQHVHVTPARGTFPAYRTAVNLYPRFDDGVLQGWECRGRGADEQCDYFQPLYDRYRVQKHHGGTVTVFDFFTAMHHGSGDTTEPLSIAHELCTQLNYGHHGNTKTWPRSTADGRTVWACCLSLIGPPCGHRTQA